MQADFLLFVTSFLIFFSLFIRRGFFAVFHRFSPAAKIITTIAYVVVVVSFGRSNVSGLIPYAFFPILLTSFSQTPLKPLFKRLVIVLPFALFGGLANIWFERDVAFVIANISITYGLVSFVSIFLKALFTVWAVLILIATTKMTDISDFLIHIKIPTILVMSLMMTYRYISVLLSEVATMYMAYSLRNPKGRGIKFRDMGAFVGQLLLRSIDRAERIYVAMKCRGFFGIYRSAVKTRLRVAEFAYIIVLCDIFILFRFVNLSVLIGQGVLN
jgi:cobalt/nickel transport system permease protein